MAVNRFLRVLAAECERLDQVGAAKRHEKIIDGFNDIKPTEALVEGKQVVIFNSNDYLGLRHRQELKQAEQEASHRFGTGPGAVRFISGSLRVHVQLEQALADFHQREAGMVFSSAFAANLAVIMALAKGQAKDSLVSAKTLVLSDELNHRSIIEGVRVTNLGPECRAVYRHLDYEHLNELLETHAGKFDRCLILTDGVFSMLGEIADLGKLRELADKFDEKFEQGVILVMDDCHGVGTLGDNGRGVEELYQVQADLLVGTLGKSLGGDGGYVVGAKIMIDYLRETGSTYVYSNPIAPGTAGAALKAVELMSSKMGRDLGRELRSKIELFKNLAAEAGLAMAVDSKHAIQPVLVGETLKAKRWAAELFEAGYWVTAIGYPVVPWGRDEIRIQINATHAAEEVAGLVGRLVKLAA